MRKSGQLYCIHLTISDNEGEQDAAFVPEEISLLEKWDQEIECYLWRCGHVGIRQWHQKTSTTSTHNTKATYSVLCSLCGCSVCGCCLEECVTRTTTQAQGIVGRVTKEKQEASHSFWRHSEALERMQKVLFWITSMQPRVIWHICHNCHNKENIQPITLELVTKYWPHCCLQRNDQSLNKINDKNLTEPSTCL